MGSTKDGKDMRNRREFFRGVTSSVTGAAVLATAAQLGVPVLNAAQGTEVKPKPDTVGGASRVAQPASKIEVKPSFEMQSAGGAAEEKQAASSFFRNPPPWPKGTDGNKYDHLFSSKLKENSLLQDIIPGPQAYFRGNADLPGAKINLGWQIFAKPIRLEMESHHHTVDEYQFYLGATFPDLVGSFDAEIEVFIGPKYERHIINKATVLYLPAGLEHNPCDFRKVGKPVFFTSLHMAPFCNGVYQTMGYRTFVSAPKID
ncbi:MAG: hypothetical protein LBP68_02350 [Acidobacteriota bacterium]|jgi:hypothetical protein|nr:hypothetical protein [Acidobacteriota bacterium]